MVKVMLFNNDKPIAEQFKMFVDKINEQKDLQAQRDYINNVLNNFVPTTNFLEEFYKFYTKFDDKFAMIYDKDTTAKVVF